MVVQGSTHIGGLNFQCGRELQQFTYEHSEIVRGFQKAIGAVVDEGLDKDLSTTECYAFLINESTDIARDQNNACYIYIKVFM